MEGSGWTNEIPALRPSTPLLSPTPACPSAYVHPVGISGFNFRILTNTLTVSKVFQGSKQVPTSSTVLLVLSVRVYPCVNFSLQYSLGGCDTL